MSIYIILQIMLLVAGFVCLVKGADVFVGGSSALARNFHVPGLIIGLTIVALGTSAPELAVSTLAAFQGSNEIAISNVVGSNTFNLLIVLGVCAVICPLPVEKVVLTRDFPFSIIITVLLLITTCSSVLFGVHITEYNVNQEVGTVTHLIGFILLILFVSYIGYLIHTAKRQPSEDETGEKKPLGKCVLLILVGLVFIIAGGQAVVHGAKEIARVVGMTETLIGLTIVAVGTSLPELVTSIVAAKKGETGLAIGNVIGSNIFNLLFILGVSAMIRPIAVNIASMYDMMILIFISILAFFFSFSSKRITRLEGLIMVAVYVVDVVFAIMR